MHGLIFETSVWLLAGSTRLISFKNTRNWTNNFKRQRIRPAHTSPEYSEAANLTDTLLLSFADPSRSFLQKNQLDRKAFPHCDNNFIANFVIISRSLEARFAPTRQLRFHSDSAEANPLLPNRTRQHRPSWAIESNRLKLTQLQHAMRDTHHHHMRRFLVARSSSEQFNLAFYQTELVFPEFFMLNSFIQKDSESSRTAMPSDVTQL
jgi:hypothetical protein